jgi:hypothetical protein
VARPRPHYVARGTADPFPTRPERAAGVSDKRVRITRCQPSDTAGWLARGRRAPRPKACSRERTEGGTRHPLRRMPEKTRGQQPSRPTSRPSRRSGRGCSFNAAVGRYPAVEDGASARYQRHARIRSPLRRVTDAGVRAFKDAVNGSDFDPLAQVVPIGSSPPVRAPREDARLWQATSIHPPLPLVPRC